MTFGAFLGVLVLVLGLADCGEPLVSPVGPSSPDSYPPFADRSDAATRRNQDRVIHNPFHPVGPHCHYNDVYVAVDCDVPQGEQTPQ